MSVHKVEYEHVVLLHLPFKAELLVFQFRWIY